MSGAPVTPARASTLPALPAASARPASAIPSETLFAGAREVHIAHAGTVYRLRKTALGKLILTK